MLNILNSQNISNILVVVTRYFGGILLGTGGLVRAYSQATSEALKSAKIINKDLGIEAEIEISYQDLQKLNYYLEKNKIKILENRFLETVKVNIECQKEKFNFMIENKNNFNFKIINFKIIREKYIEV